MKGRSGVFLVSDADGAADDVRVRAEAFSDSETRVVFYERVIDELRSLVEQEKRGCSDEGR